MRPFLILLLIRAQVSAGNHLERMRWIAQAWKAACDRLLLGSTRTLLSKCCVPRRGAIPPLRLRRPIESARLVPQVASRPEEVRKWVYDALAQAVVVLRPMSHDARWGPMVYQTGLSDVGLTSAVVSHRWLLLSAIKRGLAGRLGKIKDVAVA
jgi:hypothetical protein